MLFQSSSETLLQTTQTNETKGNLGAISQFSRQFDSLCKTSVAFADTARHHQEQSCTVCTNRSLQSKLDAVHEELSILKKSLIALEKPRIIRVLHCQPVIPSSQRRPLLSLDRLTTVSRELTRFRVHVETVTLSAFPSSCFANPEFLANTFDVIFIGGSDNANDFLTGITQDVVERTFQAYHRNGGNVVFLHDVLFGQAWKYFVDNIGRPKMDRNWRDYNMVRLRDGADFRTPCSLPQEFPVCKTHSYQIHVADGAILIGDNEASSYYLERDGIAVTEAGHWAQNLTAYEWQLLVNITVHMSNKRSRMIQQ
jgi:hypothetical protein